MINVALVDDQEIFRAGVRSIVVGDPDIKIVGEGGRIEEIRDLLISESVNVLVTELPTVGRGGTDIIKRLKSATPSLIILVLTSDRSVEVANRALKCGASGYITKDSSSEKILMSIRGAASGRLQVSDSIAEQLMGRISSSHPVGVQGLTDRELEVFTRLARGERCTHIANSLSLSVKTVSTYKSRVMEKMGFTSEAALVKYAVAHKLVPEYAG